MKLLLKNHIAILIIFTLLFSIVGVNIHYHFCSTNNEMYVAFGNDNGCNHENKENNCAIYENSENSCCLEDEVVSNQSENCPDCKSDNSKNIYAQIKQDDCCKQFTDHLSIDISFLKYEKTYNNITVPFIILENKLNSIIEKSDIFKNYEREIQRKIILPVKSIILFIQLFSQKENRQSSITYFQL